jgi:HlyD family secretion protein
MSLKKGKIFISVVAVLIMCGLLLLFVKTKELQIVNASENMVSVYSGRVEATEIKVSAEVPGKVASLKVKEGQRVSQGEVIAELDQTTKKLKVEQARAALVVAEKNLAKIKALPRKQDISIAAAQVEEAKATLTEIERNLNRIQYLYDSHSVAEAELEKAKTEYDMAVAKLKAAEAKLSLVESGPLPEEVDVLEAQVKQAATALNIARDQLQKMTIRAPCDGIVSSVCTQEGEMVGGGGVIATLSKLDDKWVKIFVSEKDLWMFKPGQEVIIRPTTFKEKTFPGTVTYVARRAEFVPKQVETSEDREYMVFEIKIDIEDTKGILPVGLTVDVDICANNRS